MTTIKKEGYLNFLKKTVTYNVSQAIINLENNKSYTDIEQSKKLAKIESL